MAKPELYLIITLSHPDTVGGTSIFNDGTKAFWSEGRSEHIMLLKPDGTFEHTSAYEGETHMDNPYVKVLNGDSYGGPGRKMTYVEEIEHAMARNLRLS